jgi:hypothetical protein
MTDSPELRERVTRKIMEVLYPEQAAAQQEKSAETK